MTVRRALQVVIAGGWLVLFGLVAVAACAMAGGDHWPFELAVHFPLQAALVASGLVLLFATLRQGSASIVALVLLVVFGGQVMDGPRPVEPKVGRFAGSATAAPLAGPTRGEGARPFRLITLNMLYANRRTDDLAAWLATGPADVVAVQEVPSSFIAKLKEAAGRAYRHQVVIEDDGPWEGVALLSRFPILSAERFKPFPDAWPGVVSRILVDDAVPVWVLALHARTPLTAETLAARNRYLDGAAARAAGLDGPLVFVGDFNATPYTPAFARLIDRAGLATFGTVPATFPAAFGPLGIPIDHVLVRGLVLTQLTPLPAIGSDHRPLAAELVIPNPSTVHRSSADRS
jgi:endonuclease/exonuclease/phosphatase (EEP) superfamily protein YafD